MINLKVTRCNDTNYINIIVYLNNTVVIDKVVKISSIN
jgi:hypothetical protein